MKNTKMLQFGKTKAKITPQLLLLAVLINKEIIIEKSQINDEILGIISCLKTLGTTIISQNGHFFIKNERRKAYQEKRYILELSPSETTLPLLITISCLWPGLKLIKRNDNVTKSSVKEIVNALRQIGVVITYEYEEGFLPISVWSNSLFQGTIQIKDELSGVSIAALLLILPFIRNGSIQFLQKQTSKESIDTTIHIMQEFGIEIENNQYKEYKISKQIFSSITK